MKELYFSNNFIYIDQTFDFFLSLFVPTDFNITSVSLFNFRYFLYWKIFQIWQLNKKFVYFNPKFVLESCILSFKKENKNSSSPKSFHW